MAWIVAAWAAGGALLLGRGALGMAWVARATRAGAQDEHWQRQLDRLAQAMGVTRRVRLRRFAPAVKGGEPVKAWTMLQYVWTHG